MHAKMAAQHKSQHTLAPPKTHQRRTDLRPKEVVLFKFNWAHFSINNWLIAQLNHKRTLPVPVS